MQPWKKTNNPKGSTGSTGSTNHLQKENERFQQYLQQKLQLALAKNMSDFNQLDDPKQKWTIDNQFGIGIYVLNTPAKLGPVKAWATYCGPFNPDKKKQNISMCPNQTNEPSFYFGSGTKPLTATMVARKLYQLWRSKNPTANPEDFIQWYGGTSNLRGAPPAVNYADLFNMTNGFANSQFTETLYPPINTQGPNSITQTIQEWIFYCPTNGLIKNSTAKVGMYCDNTCSTLCPYEIEGFTTKFMKQQQTPVCKQPYCPTSICIWSWYDPQGNKAALDPNSIPFRPGEYCNCPIVQPSDFQNIIQSLSVFDVAMMRSGIPDSDSIWGLDTIDQLAYRTMQLGPIAFVAEILGFDWDPRWIKDNTGSYSPTTIANVNYNQSNYPSAQYSSSAYTFLGVLLWLLTPSNKKKNWYEIDLNAILPEQLYHKINFAGTYGNGGSKYFLTDTNNRYYYSFAQTVSIGGVSHPGITKDSPIVSDCKGSINSSCAPQYEQNLRSGKVTFFDWDSSSGVSCGNGWGKCSDMAEIYMNMCSYNALNPIMPSEINKQYIDAFINYIGPNANSLFNNKIRAPYCAGVQAWSQDYTYNCGFMGPDWFTLYDKPNSNKEYGVIPCYGHLGATYGFCSCHIYFPGGKLLPYPPYKNKYWAYSNPEKWNLTFSFSGGYEFTISCAQNSCMSDSSGPIQQFIASVIEDPFIWNI